jgi:hypothetical protein
MSARRGRRLSATACRRPAPFPEQLVAVAGEIQDFERRLPFQDRSAERPAISQVFGPAACRLYRAIRPQLRPPSTPAREVPRASRLSGRGIRPSRRRTLLPAFSSFRSSCKFLLYNRLSDSIRLASPLRIAIRDRDPNFYRLTHQPWILLDRPMLGGSGCGRSRSRRLESSW